ncbi:stalk domain-containing protein [Paenibacillus senegalensis]|uniref:stalk domain-containing protein n=1 Tax=Paenibacillus senegalensis TaxID=1465766 RepID=UPI0002894085|nr:hypothetical protein [Paenibacillus senegalensis]
MRKFRDISIGIVVGAALVVGTTSAYSAVKQYILLDASYPIYVNGVKYEDAASPILNYEGSTYIPLAKMGDLTGVDYKWNAEKQRVEINTDGNHYTIEDDMASPISGQQEFVSRELAERKAIEEFAKNNKIEIPKESYFYEADGMHFYEAFDDYNGSRHTFTDEDDHVLVIARITGEETLPPKLSEGWLAGSILQKGHSITVKTEGSELVFYGPKPTINPEVVLRLQLPGDWEKGEKTIGGIKIIKYDEDRYYFNFEDLRSKGIIK